MRYLLIIGLFLFMDGTRAGTDVAAEVRKVLDYARVVGIQPACSQLSGDPIECSRILDELSKQAADDPALRRAIALGRYDLFRMKQLRRSDSDEIQRSLAEARAAQAEIIHEFPGDPVAYDVMAASYGNEGMWVRLAYILLGVEAVPDAYHFHRSLARFFAEQLTPEVITERRLYHLEKTAQFSEGDIQVRSAHKYYQVLLDAGLEAKAHAYRERFAAAYQGPYEVRKKLRAISEEGAEYEEYALADVLAEHCFEHYLVMMGTDQDCRPALEAVEAAGPSYPYYGWIHEAYKALKKLGFATESDLKRLEELDKEREGLAPHHGDE